MNRIERRRRETRKRILESALDLFSMQGLSRTTIGDITERADIGKGSFYEHFDARDDLIRHLLREGYNDLLGLIETRIPDSDDLKDRAHAVLEAHWVFFTRDRRFFRFFHQVRGLLKRKTEDSEKDLIGQEFRRFLNRLIDLLMAGKDLDQEEKRDRMAGIACALAGCVSGYLSYRMVLEKGVPGEDELKFLDTVLLPGVLNYHFEPVRTRRAAS
jgi:AcrR family transcriptional regulator